MTSPQVRTLQTYYLCVCPYLPQLARSRDACSVWRSIDGYEITIIDILYELQSA